MISRSQIPPLIAAVIGALAIVCVAYGFLAMSQATARGDACNLAGLLAPHASTSRACSAAN